MAQAKWQTAEEQVRGIAELIFGQPCEPGRIAGVNFDGIVRRSELETVAIEISRQHDLDKVREGVTRLTLARQTLSTESILLRGYIVLTRAPTPAMTEAANAAKVQVMSASQFAALFFHFPRYQSARVKASFGSSIDPTTGNVDTVDYVPVSYRHVDTGKDITVVELKSMLLAGQNIILLGEYGSGKSRCIRELFSVLASDWYAHFKFPFAINLRECWGLQFSDELIRRAVYTLGLDELAPAAVRAFNQDTLILLLDGFDEIGSQSWSVDESRLRQLRALALKGVKDLITKGRSGCLIAGREHYFSSNEEMTAALRLTKANTIFIKAKDEFSETELEAYFDVAGLDVDLPSWLPKRPLICQTIALLSDEELGMMFGTTAGEVAFWNHFIRVVCQRDARINSFFDPDTIYNVFVMLSRITRSRAANVGPISQRDLQDAFESVVGQLPVEDASVMLQRLPSLGRIGAESSDRQFVDMFILDGLRAKDVAGLIDREEPHKQRVFLEGWSNPLGPLGQSILAAAIEGRVDAYRQFAARASGSNNTTLAADIVSSMARMTTESIDLQGMVIEEAMFSEFTFNNAQLSNFSVTVSTFERLILPNSPPYNVRITSSLASRVSGAASYSGLPTWVQLDIVDAFDSVQTVAEIKKVGLSPAHEILVAVLKKTFKQKGGGRKEEALLRGFGAGASKKIAGSVVNLLLREEILTRHKGDDGWVYNPSRNESGRVSKLLAELRSSADPLWATVDGFNK
jgi:hypothetical protein